MRLTDHVTLNCNSNMPTAAVFLDIEKAFDTLPCSISCQNVLTDRLTSTSKRIRSPASRRQLKGNPVPGGITGHPVPGKYKYRDLALQVGGVSNETLKYGREFCGTWSPE
jgi:hypothetical protein